ncbi:flagellar basal body L-ring protein FlgH [Uliginosibacterium sediminicola]
MKFTHYLTLFCSTALAACMSDSSIVKGPTTMRTTVAPMIVEQPRNGSLFRLDSPMSSMYQDEAKPRYVGDTLKIDIAESMSGSSKLNTSAVRTNSAKSKGPGTSDSSLGGLLRNILNMDASISGEDNFSGTGKTDNTNSLKGKLAASVINVLPNGNLAVAGEKSIVFNGTANTLRFSGIVNPRDIKSGRIVSSEDVVDARLEQVGKGGVAETTSMTWLQRFLTDGMLVW